jgi:signal peptidase I
MNLHPAVRFGLWASFGLVAGLLLALTLPRLFGMPVLVVLSGSMEPALATGDVVIESRISPLDEKVGDVVTVRDPERPERLITHRVRSIRPRALGDRLHDEGSGRSALRVEADG